MKFEEAYFESVYRDYAHQNPPRKLRFYRGLLNRHLGKLPNPRILDLGCGLGYFLQSLPIDFRKCGMDLSDYAIRQAAARVPEARLAVGDCAKPPFRGPFDAIVAFDVLEHVPDLDGALEFARDALAPAGVLMFVVPVYDGPLGGVVHLLDRDPTHLHKESRRWWLERISLRFEVLEWTGIFRYLIPPGYYVHAPGKAIRRIAPAIAVVVRAR